MPKAKQHTDYEPPFYTYEMLHAELGDDIPETPVSALLQPSADVADAPKEESK